MNYKGLCVGGPLNGRTFDHDYYQFQYPAETPMTTVEGFDAAMRGDMLRTVTAGLYTFNRDDGRWHWKL